MGTAWLDHEQRGNHLMYRSRDEQRAGLHSRLNPRREIGGVAEQLRISTAVLADHNLSGVDSDPNRKKLVLVLPATVQRLEGLQNQQPRSYRALRTVLARLGKTEVDEQTVAKVLGDVSAKSADRLRGGPLIA